MPNLSQAIKEEIVRLSRKEVKAAVNPVKKANFTLKLTVAELKRQVAALEKVNKDLLKTVKPAAEQVAPEEIEKARFTAGTIKKLREKLGASQESFAQFLGVSGNTVYNLEHKSGRLRLRSGTLAGLVKAKKLGKREYLKIAELQGPGEKGKTGKPKAEKKGAKRSKKGRK
jgi:DNA-binding transcriptional regulator YiaG